MIDPIPTLLAVGASFVLSAIVADAADPGPLRVALALAAGAALPLVAGAGVRAALRRRLDATAWRGLELLAYTAIPGVALSLWLGPIPALVSARWPDAPAFAEPLAATLPAVLCCAAALVAERWAIGARAELAPAPAGIRLRLLGVVLAFPALVTLLVDLALRLEPVRILLESHGLVQMASAAAFLLAFALTLPWIARFLLRAESMPASALRGRFEELARTLGVGVRDFLVVPTGHSVSNAALLGGLGRKHVILTDRLLAEHGEEELVAVTGHELGHGRGGHFSLLAVSASALAIGLLSVPSDVIEWTGNEAFVALAGVVLLGGLRLVLGPVARLCEHDADLYGARAAGSVAPLISSLARITPPERRRERSWRHPSVESRVALLEASARDPEVARGVRRRVRWVRAVSTLALLAALIVPVHRGIEALPEERVEASLRAGDWAAALDAARSLPNGAADGWVELAEAASRAGATSADELRLLARDALRAGRWAEAEALVRLTSLRSNRIRDARLSAFASLCHEEVPEAARERFLAGPGAFLLRDPELAPVARSLVATGFRGG